MTVQVDNPAPLRIGIIIDSFVQPRWVRQALEKIVATGVATFELVVKVPPEKKGSSFLYKLYNRMDRTLFTPSPDALESVNIDDLLGSLPILSPDELEKTKECSLDVLLNFGPRESQSRFANLAKYGVWFYAFGNNAKAPTGFSEVLTHDPF